MYVFCVIFQTLTPGMTVVRPSSPSSPVPTSPDDTHQKLPVIEPPAPVNQKCLNKALTAPLTIKNFFKPVATATKTKKEVESNHSESKADLPEVGSKEENGEDDRENVRSKYFQKNVDDKSSLPNGRLDLKSEDQSSETGSKQPTLDSMFGRGTKRSADGDFHKSSSRKRAKQGSIQGMFSKQKQKSVERKLKEQSCPICGTQFKATALNTEINHHVDNCLIE